MSLTFAMAFILTIYHSDVNQVVLGVVSKGIRESCLPDYEKGLALSLMLREQMTQSEAKVVFGDLERYNQMLLMAK
jgi:hypothetical protein